MSETPNTRVMRIKVSLLVSEKSFTKQMASLEMQTYMREIVEIAVGQSDSSNWHKYRNEGPGDFRKLRDNIKVLGNKKFLDKQISALLVDVFIDEFTVQ